VQAQGETAHMNNGVASDPTRVNSDSCAMSQGPQPVRGRSR
jgi:hypothetical protein